YNNLATKEIYTLSLHDALPISFEKFLNTIKTITGEFKNKIKNVYETQRIDLEIQVSEHGVKPNIIIESMSDIFYEDPSIQEYTEDRKSTRLNSSHVKISYAVFC